jgi:hypothetical protein
VSQSHPLLDKRCPNTDSILFPADDKAFWTEKYQNYRIGAKICDPETLAQTLKDSMRSIIFCPLLFDAKNPLKIDRDKALPNQPLSTITPMSFTLLHELDHLMRPGRYLQGIKRQQTAETRQRVATTCLTGAQEMISNVANQDGQAHLMSLSTILLSQLVSPFEVVGVPFRLLLIRQ